MSDPNNEAEGLPQSGADASQADIDAALRAASEGVAAGSDADDLLSQDDLDAAKSTAEMKRESAVQTDVAVSGAGGVAFAAGSHSPERVDSAILGAAAEERAVADLAHASAASSMVSPSISAIPPAPMGAKSLELRDFGTVPASRSSSKGVDLLNDVELDVTIELGRAEMTIDDVLKLGDGSIVELDKLAGDPVDVLVNDRLVARGEVLILNDNFCVRISEIVSDNEIVEAV